MHKTKTLRRALVVAVCALLTFAIGGVIARAAGDGGWVQAKINEDGPCSLTIENTMFTDDIGDSNLVVDVYRIAGFDLQLIDAYATGTNQDDFTAAITSMDDEKMQAFANKLASEVDLTDDGTMALSEDGTCTVSNLETGVYLVAPHGKGMTRTDDGKLTAQSDKYSYTFKANIVSVPPTSLADTGGELRAKVVLKPEQTVRYGALRIVKNTVDENGNPDTVKGEPVTFTFHITGTKPGDDDYVYDNYAAVTLQVGDTTGEDVVGHIEAGTIVTVEEVYLGGRYVQVNDGAPNLVASKGDTIVAGNTEDEMLANALVFTATNRPTGHGFGGNGVKNNFKYDHDGNEGTEGDWNHTPTPIDRLDDSKEADR